MMAPSSGHNVHAMAADQVLDLGPSTSAHRLQMGHGLAPAHDGEVLPTVLDGIQQRGLKAGTASALLG